MTKISKIRINEKNEKKPKTKIIIITTFLVILSLILIPTIILSNQQKNTNQSNLKTEIIVENLNTPWALDFLPNNNLIFTQRDGQVVIYNPRTKKSTQVLDLKINQEGEAGLLGIAVDPDFNNNNFIYIYYTTKTENKVSRFELNENQLINEKTIIDKIPNAKFHDGGRIKFGPDNKLYITTGDATTPSSSQNINSLAGKILRINKDGSIPNDNPILNSPIYSYGHRNPQGIVWNLDKPQNPILYSSEHGQYKNDEINIIKPNQNYGWPEIECTNKPKNDMINPIKCYKDKTIAPAGIAYYKNNLYVSGLRGAKIDKLTFDETGENIIKEEIFIDNLGRVRDLVEKNGYLYILTSNHDGRGIPRINDDKIIKVRIE